MPRARKIPLQHEWRSHKPPKHPLQHIWRCHEPLNSSYTPEGKTPISPPTCWRCQEPRSFPSTCLGMPKNPKGPPSQHARRCQEPPKIPLHAQRSRQVPKHPLGVCWGWGSHEMKAVLLDQNRDGEQGWRAEGERSGRVSRAEEEAQGPPFPLPSQKLKGTLGLPSIGTILVSHKG